MAMRFRRLLCYVAGSSHPNREDETRAPPARRPSRGGPPGTRRGRASCRASGPSGPGGRATSPTCRRARGHQPRSHSRGKVNTVGGRGGPPRGRPPVGEVVKVAGAHGVVDGAVEGEARVDDRVRPAHPLPPPQAAARESRSGAAPAQASHSPGESASERARERERGALARDCRTQTPSDLVGVILHIQSVPYVPRQIL